MKKKRLLTDRTNGLSDLIADDMARMLQEEIDWEVMCDTMKELGWTKVETIRAHYTAEERQEINEWCQKNLKGHYQGRGKSWLFAKKKDASMFILRWI